MAVLAQGTPLVVVGLDFLDAHMAEAVSTARGLVGFPEDEVTGWTLGLNLLGWCVDKLTAITNLSVTRCHVRVPQGKLHSLIPQG